MCRKDLKTQLSPAILNLYCRKTREGILPAYRQVIIYEKLRSVFKCFPPALKRKAGLESVFVKSAFRFRVNRKYFEDGAF